MSHPHQSRAGRPAPGPFRRRLRAAVGLALAGALVGGPALAADLDDIRERIREVEKKQERTERDQGRSAEKSEALHEEHEHTSAELEAADARLRQTVAKVETARIVLSEAEADLAGAGVEPDLIGKEALVRKHRHMSTVREYVRSGK